MREGLRQHNNLNLCFHGEEAPCASVCPFGFDLRSFYEKLQRGGFDAAFRLYRNAVVFPDIVWRVCPAPCKESCVRKDAPLEFNLLERACLDYASSTEPIAFNLPKKDKKIAVVGAGLSGLTCALKFASKKYDVVIYEKTGAIGGGLRDFLPPEIYETEIKKQFGAEKYELRLNTPVDNLDDMDCDAIYVSSGVDVPGTGDRIFRCPPDLSPVEMIAEGIASLYNIEWFLKTGSHKPAEEAQKKESRAAALGKKGLAPAPAVKPANGEGFSEEEALAEAARCIRCDCSACLQNCELLKKYQMFPIRLMDEVNLTMNPVTLFTGREALRQISSCSQCGLCKQLCPADVDIGDYFQRTRRELHADGAFPPAFHDFWIRDMAFSNADGGLLLKPKDKPQRVFFPGCQLGASDPRYVKLSYGYLLERFPDTALLLRCCGAPAIWAGDDGLHRAELTAIMETWRSLGEPEFVLACPSCKKMFATYLPEIRVSMLYETILTEGLPAESQGSAHARKASAFDPCASRDDPALQQSVRRLAVELGYTLEEIPFSGEEARCCSWGGQSFTADPALAKKIVGKNLELSENPYLVYCTNCRDIFSASGKDCRHILDAIFRINDAPRPAPTATERRRNRRALKRDLIEQYGDDTMTRPEDPSALKLIMDSELTRRLSDALILEEDICAVIEQCEKTGVKLKDEKTGRFVGHLKRGIITYWAEYLPAGEDSYQVFSAYSHRIVIDDDMAENREGA